MGKEQAVYEIIGGAFSIEFASELWTWKIWHVGFNSIGEKNRVFK
jgi:hypothetical protein